MCEISTLDKASFFLVIIGGINWGLIGLLNLNIVKLISFNNQFVERIIYICVFVAAIDLIVLLFKNKLIPFKKK